MFKILFKYTTYRFLFAFNQTHSSEDKETKRALIRLYWYLESYSWDAFSEEYFEQYKKHYTYTSNTGQLLTLKPNGTVYTKTGGDNFVNLSCGFPFNPKFGNTSRIPISECLWTRTIQFESGKNFSEKFFCKVSMSMSLYFWCYEFDWYELVNDELLNNFFFLI